MTNINNNVFLGGTCNGSTWRDKLIAMLRCSYFNPVVDNWTDECYKEELKQRESCNYCLYVITPNMTGVYSIAEVVDDSNKRPEKTLFCFLESDVNGTFTPAQLRSLKAVENMVVSNGCQSFTNLYDIAFFLNNH